MIEQSEINQRNFPYYSVKVSAGFPSAAEDYIAETLDLNDLVKHPAATFFVRVNGKSMQDAGIHDNDILLIDRSLSPADGKIVIAAIDGALTVKRLQKQKSGRFFLVSEHPDYPNIEVSDEHNVHIWGIVTTVIHFV